MPHLVACLERIHVLEWHVVRCGSKNKHQKDGCFKAVGLVLMFVNHYRLNNQYGLERRGLS